MQVQRSAYYLYARGQTFRQSRCAVAVREYFFFNRRRYGSRRIAASLKIGRATVQKVMRSENLRAIQPRSFKPQTTDSKHGLPVSANLLQDEATVPVGKGEVFVGDITYLRLRGRKVLLSSLFARQVHAPHCWVESRRADDGAARY